MRVWIYYKKMVVNMANNRAIHLRVDLCSHSLLLVHLIRLGVKTVLVGIYI